MVALKISLLTKEELKLELLVAFIQKLMTWGVVPSCAEKLLKPVVLKTNIPFVAS